MALALAPRIGVATGLPLSAGTDECRPPGCNPSYMSETVVIVDDNDDFRARTRLLLDREGYDVIGEAADGEWGLSLVRRLCPDVALLDVQLPDTDGFAMAECLRHEADGTAVVIISTRDASDYAGAVARCGALGFIAKSDLCGTALQAVLEQPCARFRPRVCHNGRVC
jgi:DNA-binding NarL/FixJ family response regulator